MARLCIIIFWTGPKIWAYKVLTTINFRGRKLWNSRICRKFVEKNFHELSGTPLEKTLTRRQPSNRKCFLPRKVPTKITTSEFVQHIESITLRFFCFNLLTTSNEVKVLTAAWINKRALNGFQSYINETKKLVATYTANEHAACNVSQMPPCMTWFVTLGIDSAGQIWSYAFMVNFVLSNQCMHMQ